MDHENEGIQRDEFGGMGSGVEDDGGKASWEEYKDEFDEFRGRDEGYDDEY